MADADNTPTASVSKGRPRRRPPSPQIFVNVDEERITQSVRRDSRHCMIAEAIHAAYPDLTSVITDLQAIRATDAKRRLRFVWLTPRVAQFALIDFDQGRKPQPFNFKLTRPSSITRNRGPDLNLTKDESKKARANRQKTINATLSQIRAPSLDEPFQPPVEYAEQVVAAMDDPNAGLGPAVFLTAPGDNAETSVPIQVGGNPPRHHGRGNIIRKRMFGLRELRE